MSSTSMRSPRRVLTPRDPPCRDRWQTAGSESVPRRAMPPRVLSPRETPLLSPYPPTRSRPVPQMLRHPRRRGGQARLGSRETHRHRRACRLLLVPVVVFPATEETLLRQDIHASEEQKSDAAPGCKEVRVTHSACPPSSTPQPSRSKAPRCRRRGPAPGLRRTRARPRAGRRGRRLRR